MIPPPAAPIRVRPRRPSDLPLLVTVLSRVYHADGYPVEGPSPEILDPPGTIAAFTAYSEKDIAGHVLLTSPSHSLGAVAAWAEQGGELEKAAVLGRLFVDPDARGRGIGEILLRKTMEWATERGRQLVLDVIEKDAAAIRLYQRLGWVRFGKGGLYEHGGRPWGVVFLAAPSYGSSSDTINWEAG